MSQLAGVSFRATYYHRDVSSLFEQRPHSKLKTIVSRRVIETAQIMLRILYGNMNMGWGSPYSTRTLSTTLLLAQMHNSALDPNRISDELWNGYGVQPEANLLQWVPAFVVTQLRNSLRWGRYLLGR